MLYDATYDSVISEQTCRVKAITIINVKRTKEFLKTVSSQSIAHIIRIKTRLLNVSYESLKNGGGCYFSRDRNSMYH